MSALPFGKFFWSDYASDHALKLCSFAAQGLWMRLLCIAAEHNPIGYVAINGRGLDASAIARTTGGAFDEISLLLDELNSNGVFSRDRRGWIYSRRMIRDAKKARKARENGKKGGNPRLAATARKQSIKPASDNHQDKRSLNGHDKPHIPEAIFQSSSTEEHRSSNDDSSSSDEPTLQPEHIQESYNELALSLGRPTIRDLTPERRQLVRARIAHYPLTDFIALFGKCRDSPFLRGDKGRTPLTFDWLMKKGNFQKVLEGNYD